MTEVSGPQLPPGPPGGPPSATDRGAAPRDALPIRGLGPDQDEAGPAVVEMPVEPPPPAVSAPAREPRVGQTDTLFALESVGTAITWADFRTGRFLYANRHAAGMLGYTPAELTELRVSDIDANVTAEVYPQLIKEIRDQGYLRFDTTQRHKDGHLIPVEMTVYYQAGDDRLPARFIAFGIDITERKQAELRLRESEQRYRELSALLEQKVEERTGELRAANAAILEREERFRLAFDSANVGMCLVDLEGRFLQVNEKLANFFGYSCQELPGMRFEALTYPDDQERSADFLQRALQGESGRATFEKRYCHRQGGMIYGQVAFSLVRDAQGQPRYFITQVIDVTDRKRMEEQLRLSEERFRLALDAASEGIWDVDLVTGRVVVNDPWFALFGYAPGEVAATLELWRRHLHPDDAAAVSKAYQDYLSGRAPTYEIEHRILTRSGEVRWHRSDGKVVARAADGTPLRLMGTTGDMTDALREKHRIREALDILQLATQAAEIGIWSWEMGEQRLAWDERMCDLYELPDTATRTDVSHAFWQARVHPDDLARTEARLQAAIDQQTTFEDVFRICLPGGRVRYLQAAALIERDPKGKPRRMLGVNRDVTAQRELEESLRAAKQVAERANAAKTEFLAHMSHEIRTPMNVVLGLAQVLERSPLAPDQREMVAQIGTAGRSLLGILNDILDLSKIEAGQLQVEARPFALAPLLADMESLLGVAAQDQGLVLSIAPLPTGLDVLVGDPLRLEQVLVNLIGNAIKFTERGEVQVRTEVLEQGAAAVRLRFSVRDTGIGIPPEALAGLFSPFTQADTSITRRFGGTGLGLSICKRLVELMGGEIGVLSTPGAGSTFWFELAFALAPEASARSATGSADAAPGGPRLAGRHLLVVDDSAMNLEVATRMLALEAARVTTAADGRQALELLAARPGGFDAVLMDVQMPVLDGLSATRAIRDELGLGALPIIALTAGVLPEQQVAARAAGVDAVLPKPLNLEDLVTLLCQWFGPTSSAPRGPGAETHPGAPSEAVVAGAVAAGAGEFPTIAGIDRRRAALTLGQDLALFLRLLVRFADEFTDAAARTRQDLAAGDRVTATRRLHNLRGNAGNLGALDLMATAGGLEESLTRGAQAADLADALGALERQLAALWEASAPWRRSETVMADAPVPAEAATAPLDPAAFRAALVALCEDLRRRRVKARRGFSELAPSLRAALGPEVTQAIGDAIRDLRFDAALALLEPAVRD